MKPTNRPEQGIASPIRVLFFDHTAALGGGEIALLNLVRHLDPAKMKPIVLLATDGPTHFPNGSPCFVAARAKCNFRASKSIMVRGKQGKIEGKTRARGLYPKPKF